MENDFGNFLFAAFDCTGILIVLQIFSRMNIDFDSLDACENYLLFIRSITITYFESCGFDIQFNGEFYVFMENLEMQEHKLTGCYIFQCVCHCTPPVLSSIAPTNVQTSASIQEHNPSFSFLGHDNYQREKHISFYLLLARLLVAKTTKVRIFLSNTFIVR